MTVSDVACCQEDGVDGEGFFLLWLCGGSQRAHVLDGEAWSLLSVRVATAATAAAEADNGAGPEDPVLPFGFVSLFDPLLVEVVVDLFEKLQADDTVVGTSISSKGVVSSIVSAVVEIIDAVWVEDLVHTGQDFDNIGG